MPSEAKAIGLIGGVEKTVITIAEYDPSWPERYRTHAAAIANALGDAALQVEHIGSTSVPGLAAKPVIDILLVVANSADESTYLPSMEAIGYELRVREPDFHEHRMLRTTTKDVHIHVYSEASTEIGRYLAFRDRLRRNSDERRLYEEVKRRLATQSWADMNAYAEAKSALIERIIAAAQQGGLHSLP